MICDKFKPVTEPAKLSPLDRLKGIVAKYEPSDNVFIRVEVLAQLLDGINQLNLVNEARKRQARNFNVDDWYKATREVLEKLK